MPRPRSEEIPLELIKKAPVSTSESPKMSHRPQVQKLEPEPSTSQNRSAEFLKAKRSEETSFIASEQTSFVTSQMSLLNTSDQSWYRGPEQTSSEQTGGN